MISKIFCIQWQIPWSCCARHCTFPGFRSLDQFNTYIGPWTTHLSIQSRAKTRPVQKVPVSVSFVCLLFIKKNSYIALEFYMQNTYRELILWATGLYSNFWRPFTVVLFTPSQSPSPFVCNCRIFSPISWVWNTLLPSCREYKFRIESILMYSLLLSACTVACRYRLHLHTDEMVTWSQIKRQLKKPGPLYSTMWSTENEFANDKGAREWIPRNRFHQAT